MVDLMIDLETLDTTSSSVILSIGAVFFDPFKGLLGDKFYTRVDIEEQMAQGRTISASTLKWWLQQSQEAIQAAFFSEQSLPIKQALKEFIVFIGTKQIRPWGNGAMFDVAIMENCYKMYLPNYSPWQFYSVRDFRTLNNLFDRESQKAELEAIGLTEFFSGKHNALADATYQAEVALYIFKKILKAQ